MINEDFYKGKRVLVTGASGLAGSHLVDVLIKAGAFVKGVQHRKFIRVKHPNLEIVKGGLCNIDNCRDVVQDIDYIFHCAAVTSGAYDIVNTPAKHITPNLIMCSRMLEAAAQASVKRFLFVSSTTVYPDSPVAMREDDVWKGDVHPSYQAVGWMKRYVEKLCEFYHKNTDMKVCVVRPTNMFGPRGVFDPKVAHALPALISRILNGENPLVVWGDGLDVRDFIYIKDAVTGMMLAMEKYCCGEGINIGSGKPASIRDSVLAILDIVKLEGIKVIFDVTKPSTIKARRVDTTLARDVLGFVPSHSFDEGLRKTIAWIKQEKSS